MVIVVVRRAREADRTTWRTMRMALWPDGRDDDHQAGIAASLEGDHLACFVACRGEEMLGFAEASIRQDPVNGCETSPVGFLEGIFVEPTHRRSGVAHALLGAVEHWAAAHGCSELGSDSEIDNANGQSFHRGVGFEERERVICYRKPIGAVVDALGLEPRTR